MSDIIFSCSKGNVISHACSADPGLPCSQDQGDAAPGQGGNREDDCEALQGQGHLGQPAVQGRVHAGAGGWQAAEMVCTPGQHLLDPFSAPIYPT